MSKPIKAKIGRPIAGEAPKRESITVRIEAKEKALLIKEFGSISAAIDTFIKTWRAKNGR